MAVLNLFFFLQKIKLFRLIDIDKIMSEQKYSKCTVEGDKKTKWICGCFLTIDGYFKFCDSHDTTLKKAIQSQIDELDMTLIVEEDII